MAAESTDRIETLLAAEFDRQGWEWGLDIGQMLLGAVEPLGRIDGEALAARIPADFLQRNRTTPKNVAAAIDRVAGGLSVAPESPQTSVQITVQSGDTYNVSFGANANLQNSPFNIGPGMQLKIDSSSPPEDLAAALGALVAAGLAGEWDEQAARAIGGSIEDQQKISLDEARAAVLEAGREVATEPSAVRGFIEKVAVSGLGSFLTTAMSLGLTDLLHLLG
jgi:hypothetical protein